MNNSYSYLLNATSVTTSADSWNAITMSASVTIIKDSPWWNAAFKQINTGVHIYCIYDIVYEVLRNKLITNTFCHGRFYDKLSSMMSEGGKAPIDAVHAQEEIQVMMM